MATVANLDLCDAVRCLDRRPRVLGTSVPARPDLVPGRHERHVRSAVIFFTADLFDTDLFSANLFDADLFSTDLFSADLITANLFSTDLFDADLFDADLFSTDLFSTDLFDADLFDADLFSTDLFSADACPLVARRDWQPHRSRLVRKRQQRHELQRRG
jgi:uncharacterized protein YjbI with pentapeptide repeats